MLIIIYDYFTSVYVYTDGPAGVIVRRDLLPLLRGAVCPKIIRLKKHTNLESGYDTSANRLRDIDCRSQEGVTS